jgi:hypothetical protein
MTGPSQQAAVVPIFAPLRAFSCMYSRSKAAIDATGIGSWYGLFSLNPHGLSRKLRIMAAANTEESRSLITPGRFRMKQLMASGLLNTVGHYAQEMRTKLNEVR